MPSQNQPISSLCPVKKIKFDCQHCGVTLRVAPHLGGMSSPCPKCGQTITAPTVEEAKAALRQKREEIRAAEASAREHETEAPMSTPRVAPQAVEAETANASAAPPSEPQIQVQKTEAGPRETPVESPPLHEASASSEAKEAQPVKAATAPEIDENVPAPPAEALQEQTPTESSPVPSPEVEALSPHPAEAEETLHTTSMQMVGGAEEEAADVASTTVEVQNAAVEPGPKTAEAGPAESATALPSPEPIHAPAPEPDAQPVVKTGPITPPPPAVDQITPPPSAVQTPPLRPSTPVTEPIQVQSHAESGLSSVTPESIRESGLPPATQPEASNLPRLDVSLAQQAMNQPVSLPKAEQAKAEKITKRVTLPPLGTRDRGERWDANSLLTEHPAAAGIEDKPTKASSETAALQLTHTGNIRPTGKTPPPLPSTGSVSPASPMSDTEQPTNPIASKTLEVRPSQQRHQEQVEDLKSREMDSIFGPAHQSPKGDKLVSALLENVKESQEDSRKLGRIVLYTSLALVALVAFYVAFSISGRQEDNGSLAQTTTRGALPDAEPPAENGVAENPSIPTGKIDRTRPLVTQPSNASTRQDGQASANPALSSDLPDAPATVIPDPPAPEPAAATGVAAAATPPPSESRPAASEGFAQSSQTRPLDESVTSFFEKTAEEARANETTTASQPDRPEKTFSAPEFFPAPGPNDSALGKTHELLSTFLKAPDWKTRLKYSYQGDKLRPTMGKYYQSQSDAPIERFALQLFEREPSPEYGGPFWVYLVSTGDNDQGFPVIIRVEDGNLKVDWEIFVEFHDRWFADFRNGSDNQEETFRIVAQRKSDYYGSDREAFEKLDDYHVFELNPPYGSANEFEEYAFVKKDSPVGKKLDATLSLEDGAIPLMLTLERQAFPHGVKHIVIKDFAAEGWFR